LVGTTGQVHEIVKITKMIDALAAVRTRRS